MSGLGALYDYPVDSAAVRVAVASLEPCARVRHGPIDRDHLDQLVRTEGRWPPILVRRSDRRVIDGSYRLLAAKELSHLYICCEYFDGDDDAAFVESVRRNMGHGLPLTLKERRAAAARVLARQRDWSNRRVGALCGLSADTVGTLRRDIDSECPSADVRTLDVREGRDGRKRPVDRLAARRRIEAALREDPTASLRQIARQVGSSPETVRSVRRASAGEFSPDEPSTRVVSAPEEAPGTALSILERAFTATDEGTAFVEWFQRTAIDETAIDLTTDVPLSRVYEIADEARRRSERWYRFAQAVEGRARKPGRSSR